MSEDSKAKDEPKIIVDDDWKSQVEKEKEELKIQPDSSDGEGPAEPGELPPASFLVLMSTLATQAMASMGLLPDPMTGKPAVNLPLAKHFIDLLAMLQEKTNGNLTDDEAAHLRDGLHQLRMVYVSSGQPVSPSADENTGDRKSSTIELP